MSKEERRYDAIFSGDAETALVKEAGDNSWDNWWVFSIENPELASPAYSFGWYIDQAERWREAENVTLTELLAIIKKESDFLEALALVFIVLDASGSDDVRSEAAVELESIFADHDCELMVRNLLWAAPYPKKWGQADKIFASFIGWSCNQVGVLLTELFDSQAKIARVRQTWDQIPDLLYGGQDRDVLREKAIRLGLFRMLVAGDVSAMPTQTDMGADLTHIVAHWIMRLHHQTD